MKCIYCDREKDLSEFSLEHIVPRSLGGAVFPEVFKTNRVCARCNSLMGLFVDAPFVKTFFCISDKADADILYADLTVPQALPMRYFGRLEIDSFRDDKVCEVWMGPHGGIAYHIQNKDDPRWDTCAGGDPIRRRKEPGEVYLYFHRISDIWILNFLLSSEDHFSGAKFFTETELVSDDPERTKAFFCEPTSKEKKLLDFFRSLQGGWHKAQNSFVHGRDQRFLSKIALALGDNLLGSRYSESKYAQALRACLWEKDLDRRQIHGVQFYQEYTKIDVIFQQFCFDGIHTMLLFPSVDGLHLIFISYGKQIYRIMISNQSDIYQTEIGEGILYLICPGAKKSIGPLMLSDIVLHNTGVQPIHEIEELLARKNDLRTLPPIGDDE